MKKTTLLMMLAPLTFLAQNIPSPNVKPPTERAFQKNKHIFTASIGFPNLNKEIMAAYVKLWNQESLLTVKGIGPLFARYEYAVEDKIGIGLVFGYSTAGIEGSYSYEESRWDPAQGGYVSNRYTDKATLDLTSMTLGMRVNFHFGSGEKFDHYFGIAAGYSSNVMTLGYSSTNPSIGKGSFSATAPLPLYFGFSYGMRYYFTPEFGATAEIGLDKWAVLQFGLVGKF